MAKKQISVLTDDLDGSDAEGTLTFSVDGSHYEIELSKKNRAAFDKATAPYIGAARKIRGAGSTPPGRGAASRSAAAGGKRTDLTDIRTWAREQGWKVSERGRIAAEIVDSYDAAH